MSVRPHLLAVAAAPLALALPGSQPPAGVGQPSFESMLATMPAEILDADAAQLSYVDMTEVWGRFGVGEDPLARERRLGRLAEAGRFSPGPQMFSPHQVEIDEARAEAGFSTVEIDRELAVLALPREIVIAATNVPAGDVAAAVESDPLWSADLTEDTGPAGPYWSWGTEDLAFDPARVSPLHPLGRGGQLMLLDGEPATVVRTLAADDMVATQEALLGDAPSVLDDGTLAATFPAIGDGTVAQAVGDPRPMPRAELNLSPEQLEALPASVPTVNPYAGLLVVEVAAGVATHTEILMTHRSSQDASANVGAVETWLADGVDMTSNQPISELLPDATVEAIDTVVRITVDDPAAYWYAYRMLRSHALLPSG